MKHLEDEMFARMKIRDALQREKDELAAARADGMQYRVKVRSEDSNLGMLAGSSVINRRLSLAFDVLADAIADMIEEDLQCAQHAVLQAALDLGATLPRPSPLAPSEKV